LRGIVRALRGPDLVRDFEPNLEEARRAADLCRQYPEDVGHNCSPSFNWKKLDDATIARFQTS
jgi:isocitrate lyase